jgi:hypothetical protein
MLLYNGIPVNNIKSYLGDKGGFYCLYFFLINHYLTCKKFKVNFIVKSDKWLFKSINGWTDYFKPIILHYNNNSNNTLVLTHDNILEHYAIKDYIHIIPEIYKYNDVTNNYINKYRKWLNLNSNYDSIFIRRGDKLIYESEMLEEHIYLDLLLLKKPDCHTIFLQTDDFTSYLKLQELIKVRGLNIRIITLCDPNCLGVIQTNELKNKLSGSLKNKEYLNNINTHLLNSKCVEDMNSNEIYEHTLKMIIGIDFCLKSNICVCDYQSNVSRFIKLAHSNPDHVYDVLNQEVNYNKIHCPAFGF